MKKVLFCALALAGVLSAGQAIASDYYSCPPQSYDPYCCETGFEGFYLGGNIGVASHMAYRNDLDGFFDDNVLSFDRCNTDITLGIQLGYDWQCCNSVLGLVVDWNWVNVDHKERLFGTQTATSDRFIKNDFDWFTTIRARAGLMVCNDALLYVTAGAAVASFDNEWRNLNGTTSDRRFNRCDTKWGWAGGAGMEYDLGCSWSFGVELLTLHFCHNSESFNGFHFSLSDAAWVGRIMVNYRFGDLCCY
ncbi:MAG: outer membrane beta-barrel protein [Gammaproteobacteria bacterium]|nr:hypothetical protein [Chlamydiales bacterium]MCH9690335.1 outer membrane beta-barrel protein [Gammaproteobacteria bacterium]